MVLQSGRGAPVSGEEATVTHGLMTQASGALGPARRTHSRCPGVVSAEPIASPTASPPAPNTISFPAGVFRPSATSGRCSAPGWQHCPCEPGGWQWESRHVLAASHGGGWTLAGRTGCGGQRELERVGTRGSAADSPSGRQYPGRGGKSSSAHRGHLSFAHVLPQTRCRASWGPGLPLVSARFLKPRSGSIPAAL